MGYLAGAAPFPAIHLRITVNSEIRGETMTIGMAPAGEFGAGKQGVQNRAQTGVLDTFTSSTIAVIP